MTIRTAFGSAEIIARSTAATFSGKAQPMLKIRITEPGPHLGKTTWIPARR